MSDKRGAPRGLDGYGNRGGTPYRRGGHDSKGGRGVGGSGYRGGRGSFGSHGEIPRGGHSDVPISATSQAESMFVQPLSRRQVRPIDLSNKFVRSSAPGARVYHYDGNIVKEERSSTGSKDSSHSEEKQQQSQPQQMSCEPRSTLSHSSNTGPTGPNQVSTNLNRLIENHPKPPSVFPIYGPVAYPEFRDGPLLPQRPGQPGYQYFPSSSGTKRKGTKQVGGRGGGKRGPDGKQHHH